MKRHLECSRRERNIFLHRAEQAVDAFLEENPDASPDEWYELLGTPEEFAEQLMEECDLRETKKSLRRRINQITIVGIILSIFLVLLTIFAYLYCVTGGYIELQTTRYIYVSDSPASLPNS